MTRTTINSRPSSHSLRLAALPSRSLPPADWAAVVGTLFLAFCTLSRLLEDINLAPQKSPRRLVLNSWATTLIVGLNLLVFAATFLAAGSTQIDIDTLIRCGANDRAVSEQSWRLVACTFLHVDAIALLANMWWLVWTGPIVERRWGSRPFLMFYLVCAICASITSTMCQPTAVSVGASGAVWGVWGMIIAMTLFDLKSSTNGHLKTVCGFVMIAIAADLCSVPLRPGIDTAAHVGGLLTGMTCGATVFILAALRQWTTNVSFRWATS